MSFTNNEVSHCEPFSILPLSSFCVKIFALGSCSLIYSACILYSVTDNKQIPSYFGLGIVQVYIVLERPV